jgi:hypothetical protein
MCRASALDTQTIPRCGTALASAFSGVVGKDAWARCASAPPTQTAEASLAMAKHPDNAACKD